MVTKKQAASAHHGQIFHYTGNHECMHSIGPRGGHRTNITQARVTGACQTWKTRPEDFRLPVKHGLYESSAITNHNAEDWHRAEDCPAMNS